MFTPNPAKLSLLQPLTIAHKTAMDNNNTAAVQITSDYRGTEWKEHTTVSISISDPPGRRKNSFRRRVCSCVRGPVCVCVCVCVCMHVCMCMHVHACLKQSLWTRFCTLQILCYFIIINWIWMSCQQHWVTSGQSNSLTQANVHSKMFLKSIHKTNPYTNIQQYVPCIHISKSLEKNLAISWAKTTHMCVGYTCAHPWFTRSIRTIQFRISPTKQISVWCADHYKRGHW